MSQPSGDMGGFGLIAAPILRRSTGFNVKSLTGSSSTYSRILRGGTWGSGRKNRRVTFRFIRAANIINNSGFRLAWASVGS
jgi:hypothetical protein